MSGKLKFSSDIDVQSLEYSEEEQLKNNDEQLVNYFNEMETDLAVRFKTYQKSLGAQMETEFENYAGDIKGQIIEQLLEINSTSF